VMGESFWLCCKGTNFHKSGCEIPSYSL
jgi:hypothetical protein